MGRFCSRLTIPAGIAAIAVLCSPLRGEAQGAATIALCKDDRTEKGLAACNAVLKGRIDPALKGATYNNRALTLLALNRSAEAVRDYDEAMKIAPGNAKLHGNRARARFAAGDQEGAMADFSEAIERDAFEAEYYAGLGYIKLIREDFDGARQTLKKGLFWHNDNARCAYILGLVDYRTGHYEDAISNVSRAKANGFSSADVLITRSLAHYRRKAYVPAENDATEGLKDSPQNAGLLEARARIRLSLDRPAEALADADQAVRFAPKYGRAYATRSSIRLALKDTEAARADADKAIELDPKLLDAYLAKADALLALGDRQQARSVYQGVASRTDAKDAQDIGVRDSAAARIIELDAPKPITVSDLGEAELKTRCEKPGDALQMQSCDRLVETAGSVEAKADRLILRSRAKPVGEQMADLDLAVESAPDYLEALVAHAKGVLAMGTSQKNLGYIERARAEADRATRRAAPGSQMRRNALITRSQASSGLGQYADAIADLTTVLDADPKTEFWIKSTRASEYLKAGNAEAALADARDAKKLSVAEPSLYLDDSDLVLALIETGRIDEALVALDGWPTQNGRFDLRREILKARALLAKKDYRAALQAAEVVLVRSRFSLTTLAVRGIAYQNLDNPRGSVSDLSNVVAALKSKPLDDYERFTPGFTAQIFLSRGLAQAKLTNRAAAVRDLSEAIGLAPDRARAYGERAAIAYEAGDLAAIKDVVMAQRIEPAEPRWQALAARITLAAGDPDAAAKAATIAIENHSTDEDILVIRAQARLQLGDLGGAESDAGTRTALAPSDVEAHLVGIEARKRSKDMAGALSLAEAARLKTSGDARILMVLGDLKATTGDVSGAIGVFEDLARAGANAITANKRLGDLYAEIGSDSLALTYYAKAIEFSTRDPGDAAMREEARSARDRLIRKAAAGK